MIAKLTGSLWVRGVLTAGVLLLLATQIDIEATLRAVLRLAPATAVIVLALLGIDRAVMIWRWYSLLRATGTEITLKSAAWIYLVSSFAGSFSAIAGDAARALTLARRSTQGSAAVASVAVDRLLGLLSIVAVGVTGAILSGGRTTSDGTPALLVVTVLMAAAAPVLLFADRWIRSALPAGWQTSRAGGRVLRLADALAQYRGHGGTLAGVSALSVAVQLLRIFQAYLLGRGIGIDVNFSYYLLFMPVGLIALMLPISVAGFGAPQGVIVWLLRPRGVPEADALALSTLIVLSGILANLPGAVLYLRRDRSAA